MTYEHAVHLASAGLGSPPGMTESKSSKSSSFHSRSSDDGSVITDTSNFEDIGLEDEAAQEARHAPDQHAKGQPSRFTPSQHSPDPRAPAFRRPSSSPAPRFDNTRDASRAHQTATMAPRAKARPAFPGPKMPTRSLSARPVYPGPAPELMTSPLPVQRLAARSSSHNLPLGRQRSLSPNVSMGPRGSHLQAKPRRSSWQSNTERKSVFELEMECDEDDGDDIPEGLILDNVPISPRPLQERAKSQPTSKTPSPDRAPMGRVRSVGNGTPAVATAQGSLRSPTWKSETAIATLGANGTPGTLKSPIELSRSWSAALSALSPEAQALTEKLEEHADELETKSQRASTGSMPTVKKQAAPEAKSRVKSALAELPPLRRSNVMIDPLPISKEKEAVLSRTRPSWLPPKDPAEERRHLKEYQKMMAHSMEAGRRRETARRVQSECRDTAAESIMRLWEDDILPRWQDAIRERRTRELWWRGIAPRSRGAVWSKAVGNDLGLTEASFKAALGRAEEAEARIRLGHNDMEDVRYAAWFESIRKEVAEDTWLDLRIFQTGGPLHQSLMDLLRAFVMYRSDIGYVRGCNTIAALLLLNLPSAHHAFVTLCNLLNRALPLSFYAADAGAKASAYNLLLQSLSRKSAHLHDHLANLPDHDPDLYLYPVFTSLFTTHLALDEVARLWDVYVFEGDTLLVRAGVALLLGKEMSLLGTKSMKEVRDILTHHHSTDSSKTQRVLGGNGEEDRWIRSVREAGKS